ncbi:MAG: enhancer of mRNA decapping [Caeruleum heppii]|nr:MAG: enhancer of mRNA decapping [Caeruleum heppii]
MAHQFIGVTVVVTLRTPPNTTLQGIVTDIVDSNLTLKDALFHQTGTRRPLHVVRGPDIADLEVAPSPTKPSPKAIPSLPPLSEVGAKTSTVSMFHEIYSSQSHAPDAPAATISSSQHNGTFVDPAILSFSSQRRPPGKDHHVQHQAKPTSGRSVHHGNLPPAVSPSSVPPPKRPVVPPSEVPIAISQSVLQQDQITATLTAPFDSLDLNGHVDRHDRGRRELTVGRTGHDGNQTAHEPTKSRQPHQLGVEAFTGKRSRRGGRGKTQKDATAAALTPHTDGQPNLNERHPTTRPVVQTSQPMETVDEAEPVPDRNPPNGRSKGRGRKRPPRHERLHSKQVDGWATEDATDIQGLDDFDFQGNLSKFDKSTVFDQIRADDTTADEARLVSHNRIGPKPGTAGGKNLHYTENVLDVPVNEGRWNSEAGATEEDEDEAATFRNGRLSRKSTSRQRTRQTSSRKGSAMTGGIMPLSGSQPSSLGRAHHSSSLAASPSGSRFPTSALPVVETTSASSKATLRIVPSNRLCPVVNPLQMHDIENIAEAELGLTEEMMTENAARGIAQVALTALNTEEGRLGTGKVNPLPVMIVLAGNNKSGTRAVAGARHLRNHGVRVMVCVVALEREGELPESLQRQLAIFRKIGGKLCRQDELADHLDALDAPPELIIDALLGLHVSLEDLRTDDQAKAYELIGWMNKSKASVLAVDLPTGIDASTGISSTIDGQRLPVVAQYVLAMGAPKTGLLNAMTSGGGQSWQVSVADIGISNTAWRKYGTRRRHGVEFASDWVVQLRYQSGVE